jgi:predicted HicB family RNase H-like nuclease
MQNPTSTFNLRLPADLREELDKAAEKSRRSVNSEIVFRLAESLDWERQFLTAARDKKRKR